ncbi:ATP-dependent DNA helicase RecG [Silvibacterium dinghuense]|uniref:Probable DNA 3'-5' helicase RecG n=1 Tax=Silvibacterium dinghuense TaxID=1560006 RepID=A0A4Q1SGQ7_9BACT|nr:ATP-dependent DNA helicase RecG [Silvibacterium dinghuense]RXS96549.1 ATP-dependent DNA helicase RecG [Silvibacterium dinghuense]GGG91676.1 ATP-dependent DNA helicase RecG [Silvibacterium dinghuense]
MVQLDTPIQFVKGIGPQIAATLAEKGILTVEDLLFHLPFRYEDRAHPREFSDLQAGEMAAVIAEVRGTATLKTRNMPIFEMTVGQNQATMKCMWFRGTYLEGRFKPGQMLALYGKVEGSRSTRGFKMIQPQIEVLPDNPDDEAQLLEVGRIVPVYESLGGSRFSSRWIRRVQHNLLEELRGRIPETLPSTMVERLGLPSREEALRLAHFPPAGTPMTDLQASATAAHRRLIFEELFYLEFGLELKRRKLKERAGIAFETGDHVREALRQVLPFHPTGAQKRSLGEIVGDMRQSSPMRRLLQGDVGAGKTIVALQAMLVAIENGYQAALMAPTEILATQHSLGIKKLLEKSGRKYKTTLLTGSLDEERKKLARRAIHNGTAQLVIGTHALIEEKVEFAKLGLVVVDEQHRFGVLQRFRMMKKPGEADPDVLVMTATPIPRTLALSLYGDLDVSVLDELPPGRTPIVTKHVPDEREVDVWKLLRQQVERGHQAYIVYPVIEGSKDDQPELDFAPPEPEEPAKPAKGKAPKGKKKKTKGKEEELFEKPSLKSATEMYENLRATHLAGLKLGLLHGRLDADEKDIIMRRFQRGEIDVLVSTTVIEVGVDVPNASVMVIEHAERFGLAQLHQLRGRVGRGAAKSYCILMTSGRVSPGGEERIAAMVRTQNGFELAEIDLEQRGPGEVFGTRQAGLPDFRVANIVRDRGLLELAKSEAAGFVENRHGETSDEAKRMVWAQLRGPWQRRYGLVEVG